MDSGADSYRRYLGGDDSALAELIGLYRYGLTLYLTGVTGDIQLAEEVMEDVFFRLVTRRPRYRGESSFKTWLYVMGRNLALDSLRRARRTVPMPEGEPEISSEEADVERSYLREERRIALHRAMRRLNPDYRQALYLTSFEDLTCAQAARVMDRSRRQMEDLLYRARRSLKKELEKEGFTREDLY